MDLKQLADSLRQQATTNSAVVLDDTVFTGAVVAAIRSAFALPSATNLTISDVQASNVPEPVDGVLTISGGKVSVFKQTKVPVSVTFTSPGSALQAIIVVELADNWNFKDSFAGLDRFPFNLLTTSGGRFVYTTVKQSQYPWPGERESKIELAAGLNFLAHVTFQHLPELQNLLKPVIGDLSLSLKFYGPFTPKDGQRLPVGKLRAPLGEGSFEVGADKFKLSVSTPAIVVEIGEATDELPLQEIDLLVEAVFQKTLTVAVAIPVDGGALEVSTVPLPHYGSIKDLIRMLPGGSDFEHYIPTELSNIFANVVLNNFSLVVSPTPKPRVTYLGLSIGTIEPWKLITGVLELKRLSLEVEMIDPAGESSWTGVQIEAKADFLPEIFHGEFDFTVKLEKQTSWQVQTISGAYFGWVKLEDIVKGILGKNTEVPAVLSGIKFSDFGVIANREGTGFGYSFYGTVEASFPILEKQLSSVLNVAVTKSSSGSKVELGGGLMIGDQVFTLSLKFGGVDSKVTAKWQTLGKPLELGDIASAFGWDSMPPMPDGVNLGLRDAEFTYDFKKKLVVLSAHTASDAQIVFASLVSKDNRVYVFSLDIPVNVKFSDLPLVGDSLRTDKPMGVDKIQIDVTSAPLTDKEVTALNETLEQTLKDTPLIPDTLGKGLTIAAKVQLTEPHTIVLPLTGGAKRVEALPPRSGAPSTNELAPRDTSPAPPATAAATSYQAEPKWFNLQKTLGPVYFDKVGVQYQNETLLLLLNAALSVAGLTLSVDGLGVGLKKFKPQFELRGLGLDYKAGDIAIGGAFLRTIRDGRDSYDGAAIIKTKKFALSALGSYTKLEGQPSLFIYAFLDYPLGGPTFFFVTGLAAGFGYNRRLIAPSIDNVAKFPLITQAVGGRGAAPKGLMEALTSLQEYVPPSIGSIFFAVGVKFNSFKLVDSFALLTVEFGNNFSINLLGLSTAIIPTPDAGKTVTPLAQIEIAWKATFDPKEGCLGIDARLTPNSYILSKDCHLSGGYAFYSWFSGPNAGDFVQTLGGYHPLFDKPKHYPTVPRLALDWRVSSSLTIQGEAYFALTGSALMAGGHLEVLFKQGELRAWLKADAHFLIAWKPYHYDASLSVNVGASYTFDIDLLLGHVRKTISVDVGAELHLWGPDFSGTARIDLSVISFTIAFGAGASQKLPAIKEWSSFHQSFLPAKDVCSISVTDGLVRKIEANKKERWIINRKQFSLMIDSAIPFKSAFLSVEAQKNLVEKENVAFGVAPMAVDAARLKSNLTVSVKKGSEVVDGEFTYKVITKTVPKGLWGQTPEPDASGKQFLETVPAGIEIKPGKHPSPGETATIDLKVFEYSEVYYPNGGDHPDGHAYGWESASSFVPAPDAKDAKTRRKKIRESVGRNKERAALMKAFGLTFKINVRETIADEFVSAPQIGTL